jgi:hypothetical protein
MDEEEAEQETEMTPKVSLAAQVVATCYSPHIFLLMI